jgi:TRAP-type C4-dicarboxylate transport system substrate-binding protein
MRALLPLLLGFVLAACAPEGGAPSMPGARPTTVTVAGTAPTGSAQESEWRRFEQNVHTWSPRLQLRMDLRTGPDADAVLLGDVRAGRVQLAGVSIASVQSLVPALAELPASPPPGAPELARFRDAFAAQGLYLLQWTTQGAGTGVLVANASWFLHLPPRDQDVFLQAYMRNDAAPAATSP